MSKKINDAREAIEAARDYAKHSMGAVYWSDVISCDFDEKMDCWRVVFRASPGVLAPYYEYEIFVDSNGNIKKARRISGK